MRCDRWSGWRATPATPGRSPTGVSLAVTAQDAGARLTLTVDASPWLPGAEVGAGLTASVVVAPTGPPTVALDAFVGLPGQVTPGRQSVHVEFGSGPVRVFFRPATGNDITLVPFAGLGGLADAAAYALPFLLDALADDATVGDVVATLGDALNLRSSEPKFEHDRLAAWAINPGGALVNALPTLTAHLASLASHAEVSRTDVHRRARRRFESVTTSVVSFADRIAAARRALRTTRSTARRRLRRAARRRRRR